MALSAELGVYHPELGRPLQNTVEQTGVYSSSDPDTQKTLDSLNSKKVLRKPHWSKDLGMNPIRGARQDLLDVGGSIELADMLFSKRGEWIYQDHEQEDIYSKSPEEAYRYVTNVLSPVYRAVTTYLDEPSLNSRPYNGHDESHSHSVKDGGHHLLHVALSERMTDPDFAQGPYARFDNDTKLAFYVAAAIHDIGYVLSEEHSDASLALALKIMPQLKENPQLWSRIERAVIMHETGEVRKDMKEKGLTKPSEVVKELAKEDPIVLALRDWDKLDRTRKRVRGGEVLKQKSLNFFDVDDMIIFLEDPHVESHLLLPVKSADWIAERDSDGIERTVFRVESVFQQDADEEEQNQLFPYVKKRTSKDGYKIGVSESTHTVFEQEKEKAYLDILVEKTLNIEARRILLTVYDTFALNPAQDSYELIFSDPERVRSVRYVFNRETLDADVENFWANDVPEKMRNRRTAEELKL